MPKSVSNSQVKAIAVAMAGATVAAAGTMFVPVGILENLTGSTGLSELIPAARAPLGDTARALIAFGTGAFTLAGLTFVLLRMEGTSGKRPAPMVPATEWAEDLENAEESTFSARLSRLKIPAISLPKMPWVQDDDAITDLSDLPKLRNGDTHPDAPPRRPLLATQDLPVLDLTEDAIEGVSEHPSEPSLSVTPPEPVAEVAATVPPETFVQAEDVQPTLAEMVAQLEAAVADRQKQLDELEAVAAQLASRQPVEQLPETDDAEIMDASDVTIEPSRDGRPPLEVVPDVRVQDDNIDSALAAALATLHRMNGTTR